MGLWWTLPFICDLYQCSAVGTIIKWGGGGVTATRKLPTTHHQSCGGIAPLPAPKVGGAAARSVPPPVPTPMHQCHISFLYVTFKLTAFVFFLQYDFVLHFGATLDQDETGKRTGGG